MRSVKSAKSRSPRRRRRRRLAQVPAERSVRRVSRLPERLRTRPRSRLDNPRPVVRASALPGRLDAREPASYISGVRESRLGVHRSTWIRGAAPRPVNGCLSARPPQRRFGACAPIDQHGYPAHHPDQSVRADQARIQSEPRRLQDAFTSVGLSGSSIDLPQIAVVGALRRASAALSRQARSPAASRQCSRYAAASFDASDASEHRGPCVGLADDRADHCQATSCLGKLLAVSRTDRAQRDRHRDGPLPCLRLSLP